RGPLGRQRSLLSDPGVGRWPGDVFHRDVTAPSMLRDDVDLDHVGVVDERHGARFREEPRLGVLTGRLRDIPGEELHGRRAQESLVMSEEDDPHATLTEHAFEPEDPELLSE